ncbi:phage tail fiber protein [Synechococcus sp. AH-551-A10]|nr:phage tail fiber protein [Synechococcus sp. AH-551-A10]MDB4682308.1 phage tail fiber protein [Synechococcus sp. AH-551-A10]
MATTQTTYTGNGSTTNYSFTFEYIKQADVKVTLDTVATTAFTFANATTLAFTTAPANGVAIRIFRDTDINTLNATFFPGSAIKAEDLNNNFTQSHFAVQEADFDVVTANTTAGTAVTTANSAVTTANSAVTTANSADTKSDAAVATANTADTNATAAVSTANTASTNATNAVNTANTASANATTAVNTANTATTTANGAVTTANSAATDAATAISTANAATTAANTATATANSATTTANGAVTTANTADTNATAAVSTANTANTSASAAVATANAAQSAVAGAAFYSPVANVAGIPGSPSDADRVEVADSTGIQSFSPLTGYPSGFTGSSGLTARIQYSSSGSTWNWVDYFANDPEDRYFTKASGNTNTTNIATNVTNIAANVTTLATKMPLAGGTFTGAVSFDDNTIIKGDSTNGSGKLTLNCENNSHGVHIKGPPHSAGATYTLTLPNNTGTSGQALTTNGSGVLSFADIASSIITQTDFAYKPTSNSLTFNVRDTTGNPNVEFSFWTSGSNGQFRFDAGNASIKTNMEALLVNDSVTLDWLLNNGSTVTQTLTVSARTAQPISSGSYGQVTFNNSPSYASTDSSVVQVKLTCSRISNGVEPIANNQVLRYKTATSKWTVDTAEVIAICDGGNFANGSSLVQTSTTFDGGSF